MYKGVERNFRAECTFVGAFVLAIGAGIALHSANAAVVNLKNEHVRDVASIQADLTDIRTVQGITSSAVKDLRQRVSDITGKMLTEDEWNKLVDTLPSPPADGTTPEGKRWVFSLIERQHLPSGDILRGDLTFLDTSVAGSANIAEVAKLIEDRSPLIGIERVYILTEGDTTARRFTNVHFTVAVPLRPSP